jgi:hypothetical protein
MLEVKNTWPVSAENGIEICQVGTLTAKLRAIETRGWQMESERIRVARVPIVRTKVRQQGASKHWSHHIQERCIESVISVQAQIGT